MPEEQAISTPESPVKQAEFGFGGILIGIIFVTVIILILNYFNIVKLPFNLPHQQIQRQVQTITTKSPSEILPGSQKITPVLEAKAEIAGYKIIWQGDKNDTTGRTILASKERAKNKGFPDQFGYLNYQTAAIGTFKSFEKIPSSDDYYMVLEDPIKKGQIKVRLSAEVHSPDTSTVIFLVDNLDFINVRNKAYEKIFDFTGSKSDLQKIEKIVKQGDIIYAGLHAVLIGDNGEIKNANITRDKNGLIYADSIILRRFGGKEQIDKELAL
ncbi:MAG: hypothetical protein A2W22_01370 [Candidatus Levybacteria bacterium RBG_16_35_11]|nr:MAG: hypothetical protein A2W22_01370 [Candidatus Levybacteria bacterium RBG_16_35_11]